jgi:hypothetical protein
MQLALPRSPPGGEPAGRGDRRLQRPNRLRIVAESSHLDKEILATEASNAGAAHNDAVAIVR